MKKKWIFIMTIAVFIFAICGAGYAVINKKQYPQEVVKDTYGHCYSDKGFYYVKGKTIWFYDMESGKKSVLCNKSNCEHNSEKCNAYINVLSTCLLYYDENIYVSSADVKISNNEDTGEGIYNGYISLDCISADGTKKKKIYVADNGAVTSMKAIDGMLYYTTYKFHDGYKDNTFVFDWYIYRYDMRWNKSKCIAKYIADDNGTNGINSNFEIVSGNSDDIYFKYFVCYEDGTCENRLLKYENNNMVEVYETSQTYASYQINKNTSFIFEDGKINGKDARIVSELDVATGEKKEIMKLENSHVYELNGYLYVISTDYNKVLYRIADKKAYLANTVFTEEGKYISDVYDIDEKNNRIYIDLHDYTGMLPGTVYYEDMSDKSAANFDMFLEQNFTLVDDVDKETIQGFDWLEINME